METFDEADKRIAAECREDAIEESWRREPSADPALPPEPREVRETCSAPTRHPKGYAVGCERAAGHTGVHLALLADPGEYTWPSSPSADHTLPQLVERIKHCLTISMDPDVWPEPAWELLHEVLAQLTAAPSALRVTTQEGEEDFTRVDGERLSDRQDLSQPATGEK